MEVELVPLDTAGFRGLGARIVPAYAAAMAAAGEWEESKSLDLARADFQRRLPQGLHTPGHSLLAIRIAHSGRRVGELWLEYRSEGGRHVCVVLDIFIEPDERRRGYGRGALIAAEGLARSAGAEEVRLTVFGDNEAARALYASLGYRFLNARLRKRLRGEV